MKVDEIKAGLASDVREPWLRVCHRVVDAMSVRHPAELQRLTYFMIADFANLSVDDDIFQAALTTLTTHRFHPLTMYYVFLDTEDDREISLETAEVMQFVEENLFVHPRTGEEVRNFPQYIRPVFKASSEFLGAID